MAIVSVGSAWSLPDAVAIAVHLPDTVKRNTPQVAGFVQYLKNPTLVFREGDFLKGHLVNGAFPAIELADLEPAPAKLPVVADAGQQFVDRLHGGYSRSGNCARGSRNVMERARPGTRPMNPRFSRVTIIWWMAGGEVWK